MNNFPYYKEARSESFSKRSKRNMIDLKAIGVRIQNRRHELLFTQQYIYEKLDISQNHYSRIENGHVGMSFEILVELCEILEISIDYVLTGKVSAADNSLLFIKLFNSCSDNQQQYIIENLKLFLKYSSPL